ncbi:MAG TPA: hypothetical protein PLV42_12495 [bacterium]|nr:hypothetical protein [bacterium]
MKLFNILCTALCALVLISCGDDTNKTPTDTNSTTDDTIIDDTITDDATEIIDDTAVTEEEPVQDDVVPVEDDATIVPDETTDELVDEDIEQPDDNNPLFDQFVGTWAERLVLESITNTSVIKNIKSTTTRYKLGKISIENGELKIDQKICRITNTTDQGDTIFPQKYCDIFWYWRPGELSNPKPDITVTDNGGTISFVENRSWELRGMLKMTNPEIDLMPTANNDTRIFDHDEDGHPAFTLGFDGGLLSGSLYLVQKLSHELTGTLISEGRIEGGVSWTDDQYTVDATNATLKLPKTSVIKNDLSTFIYLKVADDFTCDQVVDTLFDN